MSFEEGMYLRLAKGLHIRAITSPDQGRGWCSGDVALNLHVVSDSRGYVIHLEGFVQRYHRYTCHQIRIAFAYRYYLQVYIYVRCIWVKLNRIRARACERCAVAQTLHNNSSRPFIYTYMYARDGTRACSLTIYGDAIVHGQ